MEKRHIAGSSMGYLMLTAPTTDTENLTLVQRCVLAYDEQNETLATSDESAAEFLGLTTGTVAEARDFLAAHGFEVETHRASDLDEDEYYV